MANSHHPSETANSARSMRAEKFNRLKEQPPPRPRARNPRSSYGPGYSPAMGEPRFPYRARSKTPPHYQYHNSPRYGVRMGKVVPQQKKDTRQNDGKSVSFAQGPTQTSKTKTKSTSELPPNPATVDKMVIQKDGRVHIGDGPVTELLNQVIGKQIPEDQTNGGKVEIEKPQRQEDAPGPLTIVATNPPERNEVESDVTLGESSDESDDSAQANGEQTAGVVPEVENLEQNNIGNAEEERDQMENEHLIDQAPKLLEEEENVLQNTRLNPQAEPFSPSAIEAGINSADDLSLAEDSVDAPEDLRSEKVTKVEQIQNMQGKEEVSQVKLEENSKDNVNSSGNSGKATWADWFRKPIDLVANSRFGRHVNDSMQVTDTSNSKPVDAVNLSEVERAEEQPKKDVAKPNKSGKRKKLSLIHI